MRVLWDVRGREKEKERVEFDGRGRWGFLLGWNCTYGVRAARTLFIQVIYIARNLKIY